MKSPKWGIFFVETLSHLKQGFFGVLLKRATGGLGNVKGDRFYPLTEVKGGPLKIEDFQGGGLRK